MLRSAPLDQANPTRPRWAQVATVGGVLAVCAGLVVGTGSYTFYVGQGLSYFSNDPKACANCHIMVSHLDTWHKSSHQAVATCNDCHLPQPLVAGLVAKADNGWRHSWAFTWQNFHEPIEMHPRSVKILQTNCLRCHDAIVEAIAGHAGPDAAPSCVRCHAGVGHTLPPR